MTYPLLSSRGDGTDDMTLLKFGAHEIGATRAARITSRRYLGSFLDIAVAYTFQFLVTRVLEMSDASPGRLLSSSMAKCNKCRHLGNGLDPRRAGFG